MVFLPVILMGSCLPWRRNIWIVRIVRYSTQEVGLPDGLKRPSFELEEVKGRRGTLRGTQRLQAVVIRTSKDLVFVENEESQGRSSNFKAGWKGILFLSQPLLFGGKVIVAVIPPCIRYTYSCENTRRNCMTTAETPWQIMWYKKEDKYISKCNLTHFSIG